MGQSDDVIVAFCIVLAALHFCIRVAWLRCESRDL
jgi:hypothetical protein